MAQDNNDKHLECLQAYSLRSLVEQVNSNGILKDDVLYITREDGNFFLLYYR